MLEITDLHVEVDGNPILKWINLTIKAGEGNAIRGPTGSGKSTLAMTLAGHSAPPVTKGAGLARGSEVAEAQGGSVASLPRVEGRSSIRVILPVREAD